MANMADFWVCLLLNRNEYRPNVKAVAYRIKIYEHLISWLNVISYKYCDIKCRKHSSFELDIFIREYYLNIM